MASVKAANATSKVKNIRILQEPAVLANFISLSHPHLLNVSSLGKVILLFENFIFFPHPFSLFFQTKIIHRAKQFDEFFSILFLKFSIFLVKSF